MARQKHYSDLEVLRGVINRLESQGVTCSVLDKRTITSRDTDPLHNLLPEDVVIVDPMTALMVQPAIEINEENVRFFAEARIEDKSLTDPQKQRCVELLQAAVKAGKSVCIPWSVEANHWVSVVIKNDTGGTPHVFYQDSFGKGFLGVEARHEFELPKIQPITVNPVIGMDIQRFLRRTFPGIRVHEFEINQQGKDNTDDCGPVTALNMGVIIHHLNSQPLTRDNASMVAIAIREDLREITPPDLKDTIAPDLRREHEHNAMSGRALLEQARRSAAAAAPAPDSPRRHTTTERERALSRSPSPRRGSSPSRGGGCSIQ
jgi:hypothetical protein